MMPAPFTSEELATAGAALAQEGGLFATSPMTIRGNEYPSVFQLSAGASLRDLLAMKGMEHADKEFIVYGTERYTIGDIWSRAMRFSNWLVDDQNIVPGDRVAIAMRNYPEWCVAFFGIVASGATVVPLNAWWHLDELQDGIVRAKAKIVVCDLKRFHCLEPLRASHGLILVSARESIPDADASIDKIMVDESVSYQAPAINIDPQSDFCLLYTSGSTGKPKGVLLTHQSTVNAVISWSFLLTVVSRLRPDYSFSPENPVVLLALPLFHVTALHSTLILSWMSGRKTVFMYKWDAQNAIRLTKEECVTNFVGVPTMANELVASAGVDDLASMHEIVTGGAKRPEVQVASQVEKFPDVSVSSGYGLTETNSLVAHITMRDYIQRPGSAGRAVPPINEIATFSEDGMRLPAGTEGEICIKSPANFREYDNDPEATKKAFFDDGWFRTGDLGYVDAEGFVYIVDRAKDLIIRGGENISCLEVENVLVGFPGIDEASVFAVPDDHLGEIVGAAVYSRDTNIDAEKLIVHARGLLAKFKVPERLWLSPQSLPRGGTGKVDKQQIRMIAMAHPPHWVATQ